MAEPGDWTRLRIPEDSEIHPLLRDCPDLTLIRFSDEEFLIRAGEESQDIFLVIKGSCVVESVDDAGSRGGTELAILEGRPDAPIFIGEMAYLGDGKRTASVRSVMATWALRLTPGHLDRIMGDGGSPGYPGLTRILCRQFSRRLAETSGQLRTYQAWHAMSAEQRFLSPGEALYRKGEASETLYQLISGRLVVESEPGSAPIVAGSAPVFVNATSFFSQRPQEQTLIADTACTLMAVDGAHRVAAARNYPELVLGLLV